MTAWGTTPVVPAIKQDVTQFIAMWETADDSGRRALVAQLDSHPNREALWAELNRIPLEITALRTGQPAVAAIPLNGTVRSVTGGIPPPGTPIGTPIDMTKPADGPFWCGDLGWGDAETLKRIRSSRWSRLFTGRNKTN